MPGLWIALHKVSVSFLKERMSISDPEIYLLDISAAASNDSSEFVIKLQMYFKNVPVAPWIEQLFHEHAQGW